MNDVVRLIWVGACCSGILVVGGVLALALCRAAAKGDRQLRIK